MAKISFCAVAADVLIGGAFSGGPATTGEPPFSGLPQATGSASPVAIDHRATVQWLTPPAPFRLGE